MFALSLVLGTATTLSVCGVSIDKFTVIFCVPVNMDSIKQWAVMSGLVSVVGDSCSLSLCCDLYKGGKLFNGKMYKCIIKIYDLCLFSVDAWNAKLWQAS